MKKIFILVFLVLCLCITGCSNKPNEVKENSKQKSEIKEEKDITIKLKLENEIVTSVNVENDKDKIFNELNVIGKKYVNQSFSGMDETFTISDDGAFTTIYEISRNYNLIPIPDYRYEVSDEYKDTREIIVKPESEIEKYSLNSRINLNNNIVVKEYTSGYIALNEKGTSAAKYFIDRGNNITSIISSSSSPCGSFSNCVNADVSDQQIEKVKSTPLFKYLNRADFHDYKGIVVSGIYVHGPWFQDDITINPFKTVAKGISDEWYRADDRLSIECSLFPDNDVNNHSYKILDEQTCKDYNLTCDRW